MISNERIRLIAQFWRIISSSLLMSFLPVYFLICFERLYLEMFLFFFFFFFTIASDCHSIQFFLGTFPYFCLIKCILSPGTNLCQIQNIFIIICSCSWNNLVCDVRQQNFFFVIQIPWVIKRLWQPWRCSGLLCMC